MSLLYKSLRSISWKNLSVMSLLLPSLSISMIPLAAQANSLKEQGASKALYAVNGKFDRNTVALQYTSDGTVDADVKYDSYGTSVAISGNGTVFAVGAISEDEGGSNRGLVRTYKKTNDTWAQLGSNIIGEADEDRSGHSVSLSDDGLTIAIGAPYNDGNQSNSGHVRVYHNTGSSSWVKYINDINGNCNIARFGNWGAIVSNSYS